ncbi:30S ribosomal protein S8 [Candidatus Woesebacteria bacterium RIFCSPHIGHO2_01_FULL_44_10]|uniref:Small ribosomal subunit protein uS8 n=1 Tax=Candidatus Woesebacteria bacterium RIFCSPLOWO2_01_FULL_44_14 TaxID=1802525 RepID=A0A1F8C2T9_9BACT|nr:MAG: 30S ribosomal protein S8 [Candidatus Woesebacteria bacterium RIFCSPHIGHO2_01_FULL_44_10]OGM54708.1 MAG: 30S ribosomal protein S8 [Candidatus Woesebacteria bacterium RIFCSPHIGHO2_12_FULL_44_11]OGM70179.1 MAG: 30S ribosomal protein S8 [Candidatus Woesebacteria bacterium RIFCSPLOWO2_01_FULL_44_14]
MTNYPVGDFLIRIKNAAKAGHKDVVVDSTGLIKAVAKALKEEGIVGDVVEKAKKLTLRLTYKKKEPLLIDLKLVSKPGLRVYMSRDELQKRRRSSILILTTPLGVMSSAKALKKGVGGEVIAEVW